MKNRKLNDRLGNIWDSIKQRCLNSNSKSFKYYKEIKICDEWLNNFDEFYKWSIENGYEENLTIDRINNKDGYNPNNCRWVTMKTQCNNRRNNVVIEYANKKFTLAQFEEEYKICQKKINVALKRGFSIEEIMIMHYSKKIKEVSSELNLSQRQIRTLEEKEFLKPCFVTKGGTRFYSEIDILNYKRKVGENC